VKKPKLYAGTNANLSRHSIKPAMKWLIATALDGATMTYGEIKERLEREAGFTTVFPTRIGFVVGTLMSKIQEISPNAPLINVLAVNQKDRLPSEGAGSFLANKFENPRVQTHNHHMTAAAR